MNHPSQQCSEAATCSLLGALAPLQMTHLLTCRCSQLDLPRQASTSLTVIAQPAHLACDDYHRECSIDLTRRTYSRGQPELTVPAGSPTEKHSLISAQLLLVVSHEMTQPFCGSTPALTSVLRCVLSHEMTHPCLATVCASICLRVCLRLCFLLLIFGASLAQVDFLRDHVVLS